jgi:Fe-S-cluster containining protein
MKADEFDCVSCGACCVSPYDCETYVYIGNDDIHRLRTAYTERTVRRLVGEMEDPYERGMNTKENKQGHITCISLRGSVGRQCSCSIYDARPEACRKFKPGDHPCKAAREEAGLV